MFEAPRQIRPTAAGSADIAIGLAPLSQIDFAEIRSVLWRGRATILAAALAGLALAAALVTLAPHEYTAATQMLIDPSDLRAVGDDATPQAPPGDAALLQVESQVSVLTSDAVLRQVVETQGLDHDPEFVRGPSLLGALMGREPVPGGAATAALDELKRRLRVKRAERTYVVEVDVTCREPHKAARLADAVAQAYLAEQTRIRADAARQISQSLTARLAELKDKVRDAEEKVEAFKARNNIVNANGQLVTEQQLTELNNQLGAARARSAETKARLDQIEQVQRSKDASGAFPEALQSPTIVALRGQYAEVVRREAEQTATLGARHPAVIDIEAQAERLRRMIADEIERVAAAARLDYASAKSAEQALANNFETLKRTAIDTSGAMVGLRELERDAQASRSIYEAFLTRARESGEQERLDTKNIRILTKAELPQKRSSPPPNLVVALGATMLGAAVGAGIVLVRPPAARDEPQAVGGETVRRALAALGLWSARPHRIPLLATLPDADVSFSLDAVDDPSSPFARAMRGVYDALRARHRRMRHLAVLVVGAGGDDGAAAVPLMLAAVAAATQRVLLIDTDLERRTLAAIDAGDREAGLVDVALGRRLLSDVIALDRDTNINLVPLVAPQTRRDRRIYDGDLKRAFEQTRRYDLVVVAATNDADPSLGFFAGQVDHIVLVGRAAEYDGAFEPITARLGPDSRKVLGAVVTGADPT